jgi:O-antigen/teichoic acid export membrane protein
MHIFLKTTRHMLYLGLAPCVVLTIFAPRIFQVIFGHEWREAGVYASYLAFMYYSSFINYPVQWTLSILERQHAQFVWDIVRLGLTVLAMTLPHRMGYGPRVAILSYGTTMTIMYCIHWAQSYFAIDRCVKQGPIALTNAAQT